MRGSEQGLKNIRHIIITNPNSRRLFSLTNSRPRWLRLHSTFFTFIIFLLHRFSFGNYTTLYHYQPDFTLETFTILFVLYLVIQHQSVLSTQLNNAFHSQLIKLFSLLCIACFEIATNGYRPKFESKSNKF